MREVTVFPAGTKICVICDLDGTLADLTHRLHWVREKPQNWGRFFAEIADDGVIKPVSLTFQALQNVGLAGVICSGRPDDCREATEKWLTDNHIEYTALYMRAAGDHRADDIVKRELLAKIREDGYEPHVVIDDRQRVVDMWRSEGLVCLQADAWEEAPKVAPGLLTLMVGPSGAGKSTWLAAQSPRHTGIHPSHVVSSDQIRIDLCGSFLDQTRNDAVFAALHAVVKARVRAGLPTVVDATNLRRADRLAVVALAPESAPVRYIVINRHMEEKRRDAGWRAELPFDLIEKHEQTFRSQLKDILAGDGLPNIEVVDLRK